MSQTAAKNISEQEFIYRIQETYLSQGKNVKAPLRIKDD